MLCPLLILVLALAASTFVSARPSSSAPAPAPRRLGPSLSEFLGSLAKPAEEETKRQTSYDATTVEMCTGTQFTGQCYNATWPTDECIDLKG
ncbi:Hypothetical predicted protein [Lecanosticta acicola]|uniref:Uncharacterized protein n=1 Tax=Lecanosticta acicola TaxID=111012 RepID=A0AAI8YTP5_9PEZI|nr:Hypothetical predicted protein [Lecanosticta acicola]